MVSRRWFVPFRIFDDSAYVEMTIFVDWDGTMCAMVDSEMFHGASREGSL